MLHVTSGEILLENEPLLGKSVPPVIHIVRSPSAHDHKRQERRPCLTTDSTSAGSLLNSDFVDSAVVDLEFRRLLSVDGRVIKRAQRTRGTRASSSTRARRPRGLLRIMSSSAWLSSKTIWLPSMPSFAYSSSSILKMWLLKKN